MRIFSGKLTRETLLALAAISCCATARGASDVVLRGKVSDQAGKPIRGASVKATAGSNSVSRFTQADGRFEIPVPAGAYDVSAEAYGYAARKETTDGSASSNLEFKLPANYAISRLTGAEIESLLPDNSETRMIRSTCISCHSFDTILRRRGSESSDWQAFLPEMTHGRMGQPSFKPAQLQALGAALEKYFGPKAQYFNPDADAVAPGQVKRPALSDAALGATIREYRVPGGAWVHSMAVDSARDIAWFSEYDFQSNKVGRFNIAQEKFEEYPVPTPRATPHTAAVGRDGRLWMALSSPGIDAKLVSVNPSSGELKEYKWPEERANSTHTVAVAPDGNLWMSSMSSVDKFFSFDVETERFKAFKHPLPKTYPAESAGAYQQPPGVSDDVRGNTYDVAVDSTGKIWYAETNLGTIARLDPKTGETREFKPPMTPNLTGIMVDPQDIVWFSDYMGHKLGRLDPKTGAFKMYQPPTERATPYGIVYDKNGGNIWFGDFSGNQITRFNPKTEQFVEYPLPTHGAYPRFVGLDSRGRVWFCEFWTGKIGVLDPGEASQVAAR